MTEQITDTIMLVRPAAFRANEETAVNNYYQHPARVPSTQIQQQALVEFDAFVDLLNAHDIKTVVFQDTPEANTPDSIFCNNWNSFHQNGQMFIYPMYAENRRFEIKPHIIDEIKTNFEVTEIFSLRHWEIKNAFLEGTGSMILDRVNEIAYAALSDRTHLIALRDFTEKSNYKSITFTACQTVGKSRLPIYHTNVMMCLGEEFCVICLKSIDDPSERESVIASLESTGKEIIEIKEVQCAKFAGNLLQVRNRQGKRLIVMSDSAHATLDDVQKAALSRHGQLIHTDLSTIEKYGGGSARCMMAEVFLPVKS